MTTATDLEARARALLPKLRARADEADRQGRLHDETIQDLIDSEIVKAMVPARFGGLELDWIAGARLVDILAQGCSSTAWVVNAYFCTSWVAATFPEAAQAEVFGDKGYVLGPCPMNPLLGKARKVDGGYQVSLRAPFGSGVLHSEWAVVCAMTESDDPVADPPMALVLLIPRADYSFNLDSWAVLGMRGTASATLTVEDRFVPDHRTLDLALLTAGTTPGALVNPAPMYRVPFISGFILMGVSALVGMARNGLGGLVDTLQSRSYAMTGKAQGEAVGPQMRLGDAAAHINAAAALVSVDLQRMMTGVEQGTLTIEDRTEFRVDVAFAARLCREAIEAVKDTVGANAMRDGSVVQRVYRDLNMVSANFGFQYDYMKELYGRMKLGLPIDVSEV